MTDNYEYLNFQEDTPCSNEMLTSYSNMSSKKYIIRLRSTGFDQEIVTWVENEIQNLNVRFHKFDDNTLSAYIFLAHQACERPCQLDDILTIMGTRKNKKKILNIISNTYTKKSPINYASINITAIVSSPNDYVKSVLEYYFFENKINAFFIIDALVLDIIHFMNGFFYANDIFKNYEPRTTACAFVYFYLSKFTETISSDSTEIRNIIKKSHFSHIRFGNESHNNAINPKIFETCHDIINSMFNEFTKVATEEQVIAIIKSPCNAK